MPSRMADGATLEGIRQQLTESLERLGCGCVDLYYMHRVCSKVAVEDVAHSLKLLQVPLLFAAFLLLLVMRRHVQSEGLIKYVGLSEVTPSELRRFHSITPVTAIQIEWSIGTRDVEDAGHFAARSCRRCSHSLPRAVVPCARELGVGIVAYSPLCRGLLTGAIDPSALPATDRRSLNPRFTADNFSANMTACAAPLASMAGSFFCCFHRKFVCATSRCAATKGCSPAQLCLAWVHAQGQDVFPIPGTKSVSRLLEARAIPAQPSLALFTLCPSERGSSRNKPVGARRAAAPP
jgi:aryl-alcohol dehydrogenase-like predicted oxidoreductase